MATSHYCQGEWRDGTLSDCPNHKKLSLRQPTVHRGVGSPGGFKSKAPTDSKPKPSSSGSSGSTSSGSKSSD